MLLKLSPKDGITAWMESPERKHAEAAACVRRGESLAGVAERHRVSEDFLVQGLTERGVAMPCP